MTEHNKRRVDRTGQDWSADHVNDGISMKLDSAKPGDKVPLREGTEEIVVDRVANVTWGEIMAVLVETGYMSDEGVKVSENPAGAEMPVSLRAYALAEIKRRREEELVVLDLYVSDDLQRFVSAKLGESARQSSVSFGAPDLSHIAGSIADALLNTILGLMPARGTNTIGKNPIYDEIWPIVEKHVHERWADAPAAYVDSLSQVAHDVVNHISVRGE